MKFLIMSDSHGDQRIIEEILKRHIVDDIIHCGDSEIPRDWFRMKMVKGNSWNDDNLPYELLLSAENRKIYVTHGHKFGVYSGLNRLFYKAKSLEVDYCMYGHTHIANYKLIDGILFLNPGSITRPRKGSASYMILDTSDDSCVLYNINGKEIKKYERSN